MDLFAALAGPPSDGEVFFTFLSWRLTDLMTILIAAITCLVLKRRWSIALGAGLATVAGELQLAAGAREYGFLWQTILASALAAAALGALTYLLVAALRRPR
jgi:hypothetical protein